jgi:hypothetical protein
MSKFTQEKALSRESASESGQKFIMVRRESKGKSELRNASENKCKDAKIQFSLRFRDFALKVYFTTFGKLTSNGG